MDANLFLLRQVNPSPALAERLSELNQLFEFQDGTTWVDDNVVRDVEYNDEIVEPTVTMGWGLFDSQYTLHAKYRSLDRALKALSGAKVVITPDIEVDPEEPAPIVAGTKVLPSIPLK